QANKPRLKPTDRERPYWLSAWALHAADPDCGRLAAGWAESLRPLFTALFRDIFGNPFRDVRVHPAWRRADGRDLQWVARGVYEERRFADLPILADALEDAGCADADVLAHCRSPGPHVRGCWVVDLLLGKS